MFAPQASALSSPRPAKRLPSRWQACVSNSGTQPLWQPRRGLRRPGRPLRQQQRQPAAVAAPPRAAQGCAQRARGAKGPGRSHAEHYHDRRHCEHERGVCHDATMCDDRHDSYPHYVYHSTLAVANHESPPWTTPGQPGPLGQRGAADGVWQRPNRPLAAPRAGRRGRGLALADSSTRDGRNPESSHDDPNYRLAWGWRCRRRPLTMHTTDVHSVRAMVTTSRQQHCAYDKTIADHGQVLHARVPRAGGRRHHDAHEHLLDLIDQLFVSQPGGSALDNATMDCANRTLDLDGVKSSAPGDADGQLHSVSRRTLEQLVRLDAFCADLN